ncbi:hypothetical protein [Caenimonas soli]|uniref:hypothetical protein n=1 Tax=Caenimonas soli TaxID=2735555 RepID=UPI001556698B|nr:hypothetical protein [Caenimonas soli]NPC56923.1 hypothetical protein [Caenimonas soli]
MATRNGTNREVQVALSRDLPDWKVSASQGHQDESDTAAANVSQRVAGIDELKKKFLGKRTFVRGANLRQPPADGTVVVDAPKKKKGVVTVRIEPKTGGAAKVADFRNGKITIVQG